MPASRTTLLYKDVNGLVRPVDALDLSGAGTGPFQPIHQLSDPAGTPVVPAQDGTDGSGIAAPAGGAGIRGWLSGIYNVLAGRLPALAGGRLPVASAIASNAPRVVATGNLAAAADAVTLALDGMNTVIVQLSSGWGGGPVAFSASADGGATYYPVNMVPYGGGAAAGSVGTGGLWEMACGGLTNLKAQAAAAIAGGPVAVVLAGASGLKSLRVGAPAANPLPVLQGGSGGLDYSANAPALPVVGAAFGASGPYANYVLLKTVPASPARANLDIENNSNAQIVVVRDDGTAAAGVAPVNASTFALAAAAASGGQGGGWTSATFKGRVQIYAPSSAAQVAIFID